ncbi:MAG: hypothetical protein PHY03_04860 [Dehalococcoidia bacterium]|nr:hypothetical protein [Dehalococcoidia bacterium]
MKINKLHVNILIALVVALPFLVGCVSQPAIGQAVLCNAVSKTGEPLMISDNFTPDVKTIYCSVKLNAQSNESAIRADWYLVKSEEAGLADMVIGSQKAAADAPYVVFAFARSEALLPRGDYSVNLFYDDKPVQSVPFVIQGEPAAPSVTLESGTMSTVIDTLNEKPLNSVNVFPEDSPVVYGSVKVSGADFSDQVKARWIYEGGELGGDREQTIAESSLKVEGREYLIFSISPREGTPFPRGSYSLRFYVGDIEQLKLPFSVVEAGLLPALYIGEANVYAFTDEEQKEVNVSSRFSSNTPEILFGARIYNAPPGTRVNVQWIIVSSDEAGVDNYQVAEDENTFVGTVAVAARLATSKGELIKGDYSARLLFNGEERLSIPFKVQ